MVVSIYWLRELPLSEIANHFELRCESNAVDAIVLQNLPLSYRADCFQIFLNIGLIILMTATFTDDGRYGGFH